MKRIWAPWRAPYVDGTSGTEGCVFCRAAAAEDDRKHLVLFRGSHHLLMLNRYPYTGGHLLAVPLRHIPDLHQLDDAEMLDLMKGVRRAQRLLAETARPEGFNIGINLGKAAGAGVVDHLHIHIVPRWQGDSNFINVLGDLRVIPDGLMESYERLATALETQR